MLVSHTIFPAVPSGELTIEFVLCLKQGVIQQVGRLEATTGIRIVRVAVNASSAKSVAIDRNVVGIAIATAVGKSLRGSIRAVECQDGGDYDRNRGKREKSAIQEKFFS